MKINLKDSLIIGLTGHAKSGKDTLAEAIWSHVAKSNMFNSKPTDMHKLAFADGIREIGEIFGFTKEQLTNQDLKETFVHPVWNITPRVFMQRVGSEMFRNHLDKDCWVKLLMQKIDRIVSWNHVPESEFQLGLADCKDNEPRTYVRHCILVTDVRFPNEAQTIKEAGGIIVRVTRPTDGDSSEADWKKHESEAFINEMKVDLDICNCGTLEDFKEHAPEMVAQRVKERLDITL